MLTGGPGIDCVDLYWLPLGAGARPCVRWNGRAYEALQAGWHRRTRCQLLHTALRVQLNGHAHVIELAPMWGNEPMDRGVVAQGPVGSPLLGRFRLFRYEVRCWRDGSLPDVAEALSSPVRLPGGTLRAERVLDLAPQFPTSTWGRDEQRTGDMWNSNSLVSWLIESSGHDVAAVRLPPGSRAPGWTAGVVAARRSFTELAA